MVVAEFLQEISDRRKQDLNSRFKEWNMSNSRVFEGKLAVVTGASRSMFCYISSSLSNRVGDMTGNRTDHHQASAPHSQHTLPRAVPT
jgi:hypothetical protein